MRLSLLMIVAGCLCLLIYAPSFSQDTVTMVNKTLAIPDKVLQGIDNKTAALESRLTKQTTKYLDRLARMEGKLKRKLAKKDSLAAQQLFADVSQRYGQWTEKIKSKASGVRSALPAGAEYLPRLDTLSSSLSFLTQNSHINKAQDALQTVQGLQEKMNQADAIKKMLQERKQLLREQLSRFGMTRELKKYNKEVYYYAAQLKEYKAAWKDPEKLQQKIVDILRKQPAFQKFMQQNSQLSSLFASPAGFSMPATGGTMPVVNGISSRASVQQALQASMPSIGTNATQLIQQQVSTAQAEVKSLMDKVNKAGGMDNQDMPDFKPNSQRTKTFRQRLEYGANLQFGKSNRFLPASSDIGLQIGYKLNDKSSVGVGAAYKLGLGSDWNHIRLTNESVGLRTYLKSKLKGSFYVQGGGEWNYMTGFSGIEELKDLNAWQTSALLGLSKTYKVGKKINGNVQLLYDFLHNQHTPNTQPVLFRLGYSF